MSDPKLHDVSLAQSELRLRETFDRLLEGCHIIDFSWRYRYANLAVARQFRTTRSELLVRTLPESFPRIEQTQLYWAIWTCLTDRIPQRSESEFPHEDGTKSWFEVLAHPIPEGAFVLTLDVTDRKRAEQTARSRQEYFETIASTIEEVFWMADVDAGKIFYVSPAYESLTGRSRKSLYDKPESFMEGIHPDDLPVVMSDLAREKEGRSFYHEYRLTRPDGSAAWVSNRGIPLLDESGGVMRFVGVAHDISNRKQSELVLLQKLAELEAVNRISTALRSAKTVEEMLPVLLDVAAEVLQIDDGAVWFLDAATGELRIKLSRAYSQQDRLPPPPPERPGEGIVGEAYLTQKPNLANDLRTDARVPGEVRSGFPPGVSQATAPILAGTEVIGVVSVRSSPPRTLTPTVLDLLSTLCEIAGNAIHRARLYEQTSLRLRHLTALRQIDVAIATGLDLSGLLDAVLTQIADALDVDAAQVLTFDSASRTLQFAARRGFRSPGAGSYRLRTGEGVPGRVALERTSVEIPDIRERPEFVRSALVREEGFVSYWCVPLLVKGQLKGLLEIFHRSQLAPDDEWREYLIALAGQTAIAIENSLLFGDLQRSSDELFMAYDATIEGWSRALDLRDKETEGHTQRVTAMTLKMAREFGLADADLQQIRWGALLHDIGKMGVPDAILLKPGALTEDEWVEMRKHPTFAFEMLSPISYLKDALDIPYCHHEKWDGSGYPRGLKGEQIPIAARLFAVVDVWDALRSDRPYRPGWSDERVKKHIEALSGSHFDPKAVEVFLKIAE